MTQLFMTYAKERAVGAIHELPLRQNEAFMAFLRKSYFFNYEQLLSYSLPIEELDVSALRAATHNCGVFWRFLWGGRCINSKD
ncbi:MAG: hypothetical protein ACK596_11565 [Pseudanabaena sp.]